MPFEPLRQRRRALAARAGTGVREAPQRLNVPHEDAHAEGAGLFHELHEGSFGGRVMRVRGQEAVHLGQHEQGQFRKASGLVC